MSQYIKKVVSFGAIAIAGASLVGCSTYYEALSSVPDDSLMAKRAGFALGIPAEQLTISNPTKEGVRIEYDVTSKDGGKYQCYMSNTLGVPTDAVCSGTSANGAVVRSCNDLQKAAGQC